MEFVPGRLKVLLVFVISGIVDPIRLRSVERFAYLLIGEIAEVL